MTKPLHSFMYTSKLKDDFDVKSVPEIVKKSRVNNKKLEIKGLLLFDGLNFCQYIEGPQDHIQQIIEKILSDVRHTDIVHHYMGEAPKNNRRFNDWNMAYVLLDDDIEVLFQNVKGIESMKLLNSLIPHLDVN